MTRILRIALLCLCLLLAYLGTAAAWAGAVFGKLAATLPSAQGMLLSPRQYAILLAVEDPDFPTHHGISFAAGQGLATITAAVVRDVFLFDARLDGVAGMFQRFYAGVQRCCKAVDIGPAAPSRRPGRARRAHRGAAGRRLQAGGMVRHIVRTMPAKGRQAMTIRIWLTAALCALLLPSAHAAEICTVLADTANGKPLLERGDCRTRVTPASTFKIAISLMGYDGGVLKDVHAPSLPYRPGYVDWQPAWRQPTDPEKWMRDSVVWYSQQVTLALGAGRFQAYVRQFGYGNGDVAGDAEHDGLTLSWIGSSLQISPREQVDFLGRLVRRELGVSANAYAMTAALTRFGTVAGWELHGKTGASSGWGWYVGWASHGGRTLAFARLVRKDDTQPEGMSTGAWARDGLLAEFPALLRELAP
jgi:beta-lactamase class D